ncbi:petrobactin biosynthesis protein AsbD [Sutcliffiella halmapala]|uniref:petrobactin biosynthesis protein AsbD n=1 Tax=Sutcliffiella halmapala TaxID=79882 RepID=UPI0009954FE0|nr:petrobactin biosynthesis protein AsbD [Sutcliffiella halmapala]
MKGTLTREEIITSIFEVMKNKLTLPMLSSFTEEARLNEDLYMDSIMLLQLILHLELDLGFTIPDEMLVPKDFHTVSSLADFLEQLQQNAVLEG